MENNAVELQRVTKLYAGQAAVDQVDLVIRRGEFFSLLGPSGCGKTTTLRLIAGFEEPDEGQIFIAGQSVRGVPPYRRNVNTVFQSYSLFPHLNIFENVAFGLRRRKLPENEIAEKVGQALEMVQLKDFGKRKTRELSGGQQQRVALARALVNRPEVLLLDEPMAALDSKLRKEMRSELKRLQKTLQITFVLVTHDQEEALTLSDRLAVINQGKVEQVSGPREIYEQPFTRFVAEFIGTASFLTVKVAQIVNGKTQLETAAGLFWAPTRQGLQTGDQAEFSLRPERVSLSSQRDDQKNSLEGTVTETIFMGPVTRFILTLKGGGTVVAERMNTEQHPFQNGDQVYVNWEHRAGAILRS